MKILLPLLVAVTTVVLQGCAAPTVLTPEIPILPPDLNATPSSTDQTKVLFFNNSNKLMFGIDNTGKVGVSINGKGLAVLSIGEYVQVPLPRGRHAVELVHVDFVAFRSTHDLLVGESPSYVEVLATMVSNDLRVFASLPEGNYMPRPFVPYQRK